MSLSSQEFEAYVPVYDTCPENWEEAREFLAEQLKKISNAVNIREIGWFLDTELLSGKAFIPSGNVSGGSNQYRSVLRIVINLGALTPGVNPGVPHGVIFDVNFTLIDMWVAATNSSTLIAQNISGNDVVMNSTDIVVTSPGTFDRAYCVCEYIQEQ